MRSRVFTRGLWILALAALLAGCYPPPPVIEGEVTSERSGDTLIVDYYLAPVRNGHGIDSIAFDLAHVDSSACDSTLYCAQRDLSKVHPDRKRYGRVDGVRLRGRLYYTGQNAAATRYSLKMYTRGGFWSNKMNPAAQSHNFDPPPALGMILGLGIASFGDTRFPRQPGLFFSTLAPDFEIGAIAYNGRQTSRASFGVQDISQDSGNKYQGYRELDLSSCFRPWRRNSLWPSPTVSVKWYYLRAANNHDKYSKAGVGAAVGVALERQHERLEYTFNTHLGGFHQVDALFAFSSGPQGKAGTIYSFSEGDGIRMFRMRFYLEGATDGQPGLKYADDRNIVQKTLAAGFFAPVYLLVELLARTE